MGWGGIKGLGDVQREGDGDLEESEVSDELEETPDAVELGGEEDDEVEGDGGSSFRKPVGNVMNDNF